MSIYARRVTGTLSQIISVREQNNHLISFSFQHSLMPPSLDVLITQLNENLDNGGEMNSEAPYLNQDYK